MMPRGYYTTANRKMWSGKKKTNQNTTAIELGKQLARTVISESKCGPQCPKNVEELVLLAVVVPSSDVLASFLV